MRDSLGCLTGKKMPKSQAIVGGTLSRTVRTSCRRKSGFDQSGAGGGAAPKDLHAYDSGMKFAAELVQSRYETPLGPVILAASPAGLAGIWFEGQRHFPTLAKPWPKHASHAVLQEATKQLSAYFSGQRKHFDLPLDLSAGSEFQQAVWRALIQIPTGQTCSYAALSLAIGRPTAVRAVGGAIGRNPLSVVVPCHRVIGSAGSLTGYAGGLDRKTALLRLEGAL